MADTSIDLHFAGLIKAYLDHADSLTFGVPATAVLPRVIGKSAAGDMADPQATILCSLEATGKTGVLTVLVHIKGTVKGDITADTLSAWQKKIGDRLTSSTSWYTWLDAQSESDRTGFRIMKWGTPTVPDVTLNGEDRELSFPIMLRISIARYRVTRDTPPEE